MAHYHTASDLEYYRERLALLQAGKLSPIRIIGKGYKHPKAQAIHWLESIIAEIAHDLEVEVKEQALTAG